jgi:tRNA(fMet)-specific endonuclease VapC
MVLLDTNHCSYAILGNTQVLDRLANLGDEPITTCTIVKGELIAHGGAFPTATG